MTTYNPSEYFKVPDGTLVSSLFSNNVGSRNISAAYGIIEADSSSEIHLHPVLEQTTIVLNGELSITTGVVSDNNLIISEDLVSDKSAKILAPMSFFQMTNKTTKNVDVIYICSPSFLYCKDEKGALFNDAITFGYNWDNVMDKFNPENMRSFLNRRENL